jgi:dolichyl-phosphate-mannose--protein O-mannosyl transferase
VLAYLITWSGWLLSSGGYDRQWANQPGNAWTGPLAWVPHSLQSLLEFHRAAYGWHIGLDRPHSVMAPAWSWLPLLRPSVVYTLTLDNGQAGCEADQCVRTITNLPNPIIWWSAVLACLYLVYLLIRRRNWRYGLILMGVVAGYLPWLLYPERTMFFFYSIAFEPYLILGLTAVIALILGKPTDPSPVRQSGLAVVGIFVGFAIIISAFWYPLTTGQLTSLDFWQLHQWLPGWYTDIFSPPPTPSETPPAVG